MVDSFVSDIVSIRGHKLFIRIGDNVEKFKGRIFLVLFFIALVQVFLFLIASIYLHVFSAGDLYSFLGLTVINEVLVLGIFVGGLLAYFWIFGALERDPFSLFIFKVRELDELRRRIRLFDSKKLLALVVLSFLMSVVLTVNFYGFFSNFSFFDSGAVNFLLISYSVLLFLIGLSTILWMYIFSIFTAFLTKNYIEVVFDREIKVIYYKIRIYGRYMERHAYFNENLGHPFMKNFAIIFDLIHPSLHLQIQHEDYIEFLQILRAPLKEIKKLLKKILEFQTFPTKKVFFTKPILVDEFQIE